MKTKVEATSKIVGSLNRKSLSSNLNKTNIKFKFKKDGLPLSSELD